MTEFENQWKIDVNDRYQKVVGVVVSLSTASLVLPIMFLRQIVGIREGQSIIDVISYSVYLSWIFLGLSILAAIIYFYSSAKWVKLAWGQEPDFFGKKITDETWIEELLDTCYCVMIVGFSLGLFCILFFIVNYSSKLGS